VWDILGWKDADRLADLVTFIGATRPGYDLARFSEARAAHERPPRVELMEVPALAISSTDIRTRVAEHRPVRYLLPEAVAAYILKHRLYEEGR